MRIRLSIIRAAALGAAVAVLTLLAEPPQAAAQDGSAVKIDDGSAVNQGSPATERLLGELRAGGDASPDAAIPAAEAAKPRTDGTLAETVEADGKLADQQPAPVDGDLSADGKIAAPPAATADARATQADEPVAGDDAIASPRRLRPVATDVEADPYAPVGILRGGFLILPGITASSVFSDNVLVSNTNRQSDIALVLRPAVSVQSQWTAHSLSLDLRGATTSYARLESQDVSEFHANLKGRFDLTSRSNLEAEAAYDFSPVSRNDPTVPVGAALQPTTHTDTIGLAYNQTIDRLHLRLHGTTAGTTQGDSGDGGEQYVDNDLNARAAYEFSPKLTVFGTAKGFNRGYANDSGINVAGDDVRVGLQVDPSPKLSALVSIGQSTVAPTSSGDAAASGLVAELNATWLPTALTTVSLVADADLDVTDEVGAVAVRTRKASVEVKHQLRRWVTLLAGVSLESLDYVGAGLTEDKRNAHLGVEYDFNREWALLADYRRTDVISNDASRSYAEDLVTLGVRLQR